MELQSPSPLWCGGDPAMINQSYLFHIFLTVITKTINLKFENVLFTKHSKKSLMVGHLLIKLSSTLNEENVKPFSSY